MTGRSSSPRLADIVEAIELIDAEMAGVTLAELQTDRRKRWLVERGIEAGSARKTVEVGTFPPNAWGIYEMHGNVWEWCEDVWHPNYAGAPQDGSAWRGGDSPPGVPLRVVRGGCWFDRPIRLRSASRGYGIGVLSGSRADPKGFRIIRSV
jgi:formylglycine-generating enzyme required for sulfatase activity